MNEVDIEIDTILDNTTLYIKEEKEEIKGINQYKEEYSLFNYSPDDEKDKDLLFYNESGIEKAKNEFLKNNKVSIYGNELYQGKSIIKNYIRSNIVYNIKNLDNNYINSNINNNENENSNKNLIEKFVVKNKANSIKENSYFFTTYTNNNNNSHINANEIITNSNNNNIYINNSTENTNNNDGHDLSEILSDSENNNQINNKINIYNNDNKNNTHIDNKVNYNDNQNSNEILNNSNNNNTHINNILENIKKNNKFITNSINNDNKEVNNIIDIKNDNKINKEVQKEIFLEVKDINTYNEYKDRNIILTQSQENAPIYDLGYLYGPSQKKKFIGFQMKSLKDKINSKFGKINKNYIIKNSTQLLFTSKILFNVNIIEWYYIVVGILFDNNNENKRDIFSEEREYSEKLKKHCELNGIEFIYYNPFQKIFLDKNKNNLKQLNLKDSNLFPEEEPNIYPSYDEPVYLLNKKLLRENTIDYYEFVKDFGKKKKFDDKNYNKELVDFKNKICNTLKIKTLLFKQKNIFKDMLNLPRPGEKEIYLFKKKNKEESNSCNYFAFYSKNGKEKPSLYSCDNGQKIEFQQECSGQIKIETNLIRIQGIDTKLS